MYHHESLKSINTFSILEGLFDYLSGLLILHTHCNIILFTQNILLCLLFLQIHLFDIFCLLCLISESPCWSATFSISSASCLWLLFLCLSIFLMENWKKKNEIAMRHNRSKWRSWYDLSKYKYEVLEYSAVNLNYTFLWCTLIF